MDLQNTQYTKYEIARIIGARALQIAMDAPLLFKISEDELKAIKYDSIKIAEREFEAGALPIAINRPTPRKRRDRLSIKEEKEVTDEELAAKEHEVEKDIAENAEELGLVEAEEEPTELADTGDEQ